MLAAQLKVAQAQGGYVSNAAVDVVRALRDHHNVFARPLGDVVYLMVPPTVAPGTCERLQGALQDVLDNLDELRGGKEAGDGYVV